METKCVYLYQYKTKKYLWDSRAAIKKGSARLAARAPQKQFLQGLLKYTIAIMKLLTQNILKKTVVVMFLYKGRRLGSWAYAAPRPALLPLAERLGGRSAERPYSFDEL